MPTSIIDVIRNRRSVRTFNGEALRPEDLQKLRDFIPTIETPFDVPVDIRILNAKEHKLSSPVILGAELYTAAKVRRVLRGEEALGYAMEQLVIYAASLGIGTVWLAATLSRQAFEAAMELTSEEVMPAATPLGYPAEKMSSRETLMRKGIKADQRLPFESIFFRGDFSTPLTQAEAGVYAVPLELVQRAPSATNKQPWRAVVENGNVHFYEKKTKGYAKEATGDIQKVDLGIALAHFVLAVKELGIAGALVDQDPGIAHEDDTEYILSFVAE